MGKKKKLIIIAVVLIVGITSTVFAMSRFASIIQRMNSADSEQAFLDELSSMTTEEIIDEMNVLLNSGSPDDNITYHAMSLMQRLDKIDGDFLLSASVDSRLHPTIRYTMIQLYGEKLGNDADSEKLLKIILDEDENTTVRANAIYSLPSDDIQVQKVIAATFFTIDESELAYDCLKFLWNRNRDIAEAVADEVLTDYSSYSPERICAALTGKGYLLRKNTAGRSFDELMTEKDKFADICIEIHETYEEPLSSGRKEYVAAYDPVRISVSSMAKIGSEKSARYLLDEDGFISSNRLGDDLTWSVCGRAVRANYPALAKLAQTSEKEDDIDLLLTATKYFAYKDIVDALQKKIDNEEIKGKQIVLPSGFDGYFATPDTGDIAIFSWEVMR